MYYNLGSLTIGFTAWVLGYIGIRAEKHKSYFQFSSFTCCCISLFLQFLEIKRRMQMDDWVAVDDTIQGITVAACILISITVVLNFISERSKKEEML